MTLMVMGTWRCGDTDGGDKVVLMTWAGGDTAGVTLVVVIPKQEETLTVGISPTFLSLQRGGGLFYQP